MTSEEISAGIVDNAYEDFLSSKRNALIVKNLVTEAYRANNVKKNPVVRVSIREVTRDFDRVARNLNSFVIGRNLNDDEYRIYEVEYNSELINNLRILDRTKTPLTKGLATLPLSQTGLSNLMIRCAETANCDLFLASPISKIVGDKLYEIGQREKEQRQMRIPEIIEGFVTEVEFPSLREHVNNGRIELHEVLGIRAKATRFREWLQCEADRDRDALIAYHNEVAKESGFTRRAKSTLQLFGVLAQVGVSIGAEAFFKDADTLTKEVVKNLSGKGIETLSKKISGQLFSKWKPICFGNWYREEIKRLLDSQEHN